MVNVINNFVETPRKFITAKQARISPDSNVKTQYDYQYLIIVSNKLLGLSRFGLGLEFGSGFILELSNVVTSTFIGLQRSAADLHHC